MQELILDLDTIINKVILLKEENTQLNKKIEELENINRQLKVDVGTLSTKTNTIFIEQQKDQSQSDREIINDTIIKDESRFGSLTQNEVIERLNEIELELNGCLKILENKS